MVKVRWAQERDIWAVKQLADNNRAALGFVVRASLEERVRHRELLVGERRGEVVGFVSFHHCRDGWTTIYELCVDERCRKQGVGRALVEAVKDDALKVGQKGIRLKCPLDLPANGFYARLGFTRVAIQEGKRRPLAVWEKRIWSATYQSGNRSLIFFVTLTNSPKAVKDIIRLWDEKGDGRNPFKHIVFTPLFSSPATISEIRRLKEERSSVVMFDSGGYQVQMGKISYEELFDRLLRFYQENDWADWYVLPDHVPRSTDTDLEVEFKVRETLDFARLFVRMMPEGFAEKAVGVVHGRTEEQIRRCVNAYVDMGVRYLGFGSFGTSGPNGMVNLISQKSLRLLRLLQTLSEEKGLQVHIFGIGSPSHLIRLAQAGIMPTSFDSAGWWKAAGFGYVFTGSRSLRVCLTNRMNSTIYQLEKQLEKDGHSCIFCENTKKLRKSRLHRVMHNLVIITECAAKLKARG